MQPFHHDLRCPVPNDKSITHAAAAPNNLDAAITMRSAHAEFQNTIEFLQFPTGEDVETKLSYETSFNVHLFQL